MRSILLFITVILSTCLLAQDVEQYELAPNYYPEGVYPDFESFLDVKPSRRKTRVEARDVFRPKIKIDDPFIDNCYFYDQRTNKRMKDVFAISHAGSLYIHAKSLHKFIGDKKDRRLKVEHKDSFFRVIEQGEYLYLEGYFVKGGGIGFSIGSGPISIGTGGPREQFRGIVFDFEKESFDVFRDCKDFNRFLALDYRDLTFECDSKEVPMDIIREIIYEVNAKGIKP